MCYTLCMVSLTTRFRPAQSRHQSHCTPPQCAGTGWWPRRSPPAAACSAAPAALGLSSAGCLVRAHIQLKYDHIVYTTGYSFIQPCLLLSDQQKTMPTPRLTYADGRQQVTSRISHRFRLSSAAFTVSCQV